MHSKDAPVQSFGSISDTEPPGLHVGIGGVLPTLRMTIDSNRPKQTAMLVKTGLSLRRLASGGSRPGTRHS
jgi:hypothetical protein